MPVYWLNHCCCRRSESRPTGAGSIHPMSVYLMCQCHHQSQVCCLSKSVCTFGAICSLQSRSWTWNA
uniref:Uncharacterized protein n=1 Tax=Arundo donax TaxID=35708 RepID=A0A0A9GYK1_ARUDO